MRVNAHAWLQLILTSNKSLTYTPKGVDLLHIYAKIGVILSNTGSVKKRQMLS